MPDIQQGTQSTSKKSKMEPAQCRLVLSQREYTPTPYKDSQWEVIGERLQELGFVPLELSVVHTERAAPDPMFERFDVDTYEPAERVWHLPGNQMYSGNEKEEQAFDPAIIEAELAAAFEAGKKAGFEEGFAAAQQTISERYIELGDKLKHLSHSMLEQMQGMYARIEKGAVELALNVSKKILTTTVDVKPEYIIDVIREALKNLGAAKPLRVRVSVDDFEFLEVIGLPPELSTQELGVQYVADESVKSGCVVETDFGEVDLQLDRMWDQIKERLYEVYR